MRSSSSSSSSMLSRVCWKTLFLGSLLGYLTAVVLEAHQNPSSFLSRYLLAEASATPEQEEEEKHEQEEEEEASAATMDTTLVAIIMFLIIMTIVFEKVKELVEAEADRTMRPVIDGLFGEMTVLGFLSIMTFCVTKLGVFETISVKLFGEEEKEEFLEMFEMAHYMLFFIMLFFVVNVLVLVRGGEEMEKTWRAYNMACRDPEYLSKLDALMENHNQRQPHHTTYFEFLFWNTLVAPFCKSDAKHTREELQLFRGLRREFVLERLMEPPFAPHLNDRVPDDFDFGRYLSICLGHKLSHMVHLSIKAWIALGVFSLIFCIIAVVIENDKEAYCWFWAGGGWLLFLAGNYFDFHILGLLEHMVSFDCHSVQQNGEGDALLSGSESMPLWTSIDLDQYLEKERPLMAQLYAKSHHHSKLTRQDTLYWSERNGPKLYLFLFQIQLVFTATYVSVLFLSFIPFLFFESVQSTAERVAYLIVSLLPVYLLLTKYKMASADLTMEAFIAQLLSNSSLLSDQYLACSIGIHRKIQAVSQVIREDKTESVIRAMVTMQQLQKRATNGFVAASNIPSATHQQGECTASSAVQLANVSKTFDVLDKDKSGDIDEAEFKHAFAMLGFHFTDESLNAMVYALDTNNDGTICKDEFLEFYKAHMVFDLDRQGIQKLAEELFEVIDSDGSGEITLSEFKDVLLSFNVGFHIDEIGDMANEIDELDNGTINEQEFVNFLFSHEHLFELLPLPSLE